MDTIEEKSYTIEYKAEGEKRVEINEEAVLPAESNTTKLDEKKLMRKIDWAILPWVSILYLLSFLDRTSIGNARLYGMETDLHLTDKQYLICLSVYFIPYSLCEVPSNIVIRRARPSKYLSIIMILWGAMMMLQGFVHNFNGLLATRFMLGVFEAGLFPGVAFYLSCWYKRNELGFRIALFNSANQLSGAFAGLLAAAISNMKGLGGRPAWAWIFILEGLATIVIAVACFFFMQDFPDNARFLSEPEREYIIHRLQSDDQYSAAGEKMSWKNIRKSLKDWKTWLFALNLMSRASAHNGPLYASAIFLPSIINQLGFSATPANLLTVPVYAVACVVTCLVGYVGDKHGNRGYLNMGLFFTGTLGYLILVFSRKAALSYFAVFLVISGIFPITANTNTWIANNVEGSYKRAVTIAMGITMGNLHGSITSLVYPASEAPFYTRGHEIMIGYTVFGFFAALIFRTLLRMENSRRERGERDEFITGIGIPQKNPSERNGIYESIEAAQKEKGDEYSGFRYIL